jgi:hypothetical protein
MQLRQICNTPHLFYKPWELRNTAVGEEIVTASGKMLLLDRLLPFLFSRGHRVLVFSQFSLQLDLLEDYCILRKWDFCRISGNVSHEERREEIARFNARGSQTNIFLLGTKAGGVGINLATADTVILFDSDWNPQLDLQAQDRAHRIGQMKPVIVYRLTTKETVEKRLLTSAEQKRRLEKLVIKKGTLANKRIDGEGLGKDDLEAVLLKDGIVYRHSGGGEQILSDEDLEALCDRYVDFLLPGSSDEIGDGVGADGDISGALRHMIVLRRVMVMPTPTRSLRLARTASPPPLQAPPLRMPRLMSRLTARRSRTRFLHFDTAGRSDRRYSYRNAGCFSVRRDRCGRHKALVG